MNIRRLLLTTLITMAGAQSALAMGVDSKMKGFELKSCSATGQECLVVKAQKTEGSQLRPLQMLSKPEITITKKNNTTVLQADTGYVDLAENQLVVYKKQNGRTTETSINLTTFQRQDLPMGAL